MERRRRNGAVPYWLFAHRLQNIYDMPTINKKWQEAVERRGVYAEWDDVSKEWLVPKDPAF